MLTMLSIVTNPALFQGFLNQFPIYDTTYLAQDEQRNERSQGSKSVENHDFITVGMARYDVFLHVKTITLTVF